MRIFELAVGVGLIAATWLSVVVSLVMPRGLRSSYTRFVHAAVRWPFQALADRCRTYETKDRVLAWAAPGHPGHPDQLARAVPGRLRPAAGRGQRAGLRPGVPGGRVLAVHPRFRVQRPRPADPAGLLRRGHRPGGDRPADRLPAGALLGVFAPRGRGDAASVARRRAGLGAGDPLPARAGARAARQPAGALPGLGAVGGGDLGEPHQLSGADPLPLAAAVPQLADRAARGD